MYCKACNAPIFDDVTNEVTGELEELCSVCLAEEDPPMNSEMEDDFMKYYDPDTISLEDLEEEI